MNKAVFTLGRVLMLVTVGIALLGGLGSGLARLGVGTAMINVEWSLLHGPLMICGFLGTLICLERAVALSARLPWSMAVPAVNAAGAAWLLLAPDAVEARLLLMLGSAGLALLFGYMLKMHPSRDVGIMALGSICWLAGNVLWLSGQPVFQTVHLWTAFLILTIVGERLELSRVRRLTAAQQWLLVGVVGVYSAGVALTAVNLELGVRMLGAGAVLVAIWLLRYDIARRTIRQRNLPRYIAACLLLGYVWLAIGGAFAVWKGLLIAGPDYEMTLHAFLLGFVFSMIFGHMPMILPALTGLQLNFSPVFYVHLAMLHVTLAYRIVGNLTLDHAARQAGGTLNVASVLLFLAITAISVLRSNLRRPAVAIVT